MKVVKSDENPFLNIISPKHKQICDHILRGVSHTEAYELVYPTCKKAASASATRLLKNDSVKGYLEFEKLRLQKKVNVDREWVLRELMEVIQSCKEEGIDGTGQFKERTNWTNALKTLSRILGLETKNVNIKNIDLNNFDLKFPELPESISTNKLLKEEDQEEEDGESDS